MERASAHLAKTEYFDAEDAAMKALAMARTAADFERMARICLPLQEARRQKRLAAVDTGRLVRFADETGDFELDLEKPEAGCYLFEPLLVAADAREFRDRAHEKRVPVLTVAREPETTLRRWPIAMIGPVTVRVQVEPPDDEPDLAWIVMASEALGDAAIESLDLDRPAHHLVDQIIERLATCPEHEKLHQRLEEACRAAHEEQQAGNTPTDDEDDPLEGDDTLDV